mmetsp:Transcript_24797/g.32287  ORF Transcript_24797/g.32287 Transcript_24797/m.32287 type:complete len:80 (+) Transcript_24797:133-372(+)
MVPSLVIQEQSEGPSVATFAPKLVWIWLLLLATCQHLRCPSQDEAKSKLLSENDTAEIPFPQDALDPGSPATLVSWTSC